MTSHQPTVLHIRACVSDGLETARPKASRGCSPCDEYFRLALGKMWAKDRQDIDVNSNTVFILDKLPQGFEGFEKARQTKAGHIDRWIYGHRNGYFDSTVKFYVHFKHLMDHGSTTACRCVRCVMSNTSNAQTSNGESFITQKWNNPTAAPQSNQGSHNSGTNSHQGSIAGGLYANIIPRISKLNTGTIMDQAIDERKTHWPFDHADHSLQATFDALVRLPARLHRPGEIILFKSNEEQNTFGAGLVIRSSVQSGQALIQVREITKKGAGLVANVKGQNALPFSDWTQTSCTESTALQDSVRFAFDTATSVSPVSPYRIRASSINGLATATIQCRGIYMAHELILSGDYVHLSTQAGLDNSSIEANWAGPLLLHVSQVKLRLVNFTSSRCDVCIHVTGRVFSEAPADSFGGHGKAPVSESDMKTAGYVVQDKQLYHLLDPAQPRLRLQIPFNRLLGRYRGGNINEAIQDHRTSNENREWAWYESRLQQLGLQL